MSSTQQRHYPKSTLASTKSLRPKLYQRQTAAPSGNDMDVFVGNSIYTLRRSAFNTIDERCHLEKFERTKYQRDQEIKDMEEIDQLNLLSHQASVRESYRDHARSLKETADMKTAKLIVNHKATQKVKRDRVIRDLQFEMAMQEVKTLKKEKARQVYCAEQQDGIVGFEKIMKRSGIGANDSGNALSISYEDGETFINRLEETAKEKWPTKEEVGDFLTQLKQRTTDNKVARYEKARRRRRAAVDQAEAAMANQTAANIETA